MPHSTPPLARQLDHGSFNRFLATLSPHDFALLAPHLRTARLERGVQLLPGKIKLLDMMTPSSEVNRLTRKNNWIRRYDDVHRVCKRIDGAANEVAK